MLLQVLPFLCRLERDLNAKADERIERAKLLHSGNPGGGALALRWPGRQRRRSLVAVGLMVCPPAAKERLVGYAINWEDSWWCR